MNLNFGDFGGEFQGYNLNFWPKMAHFHHLSISIQNELISILVICGENTEVIALLVGQKVLSFILCESGIKMNEHQVGSVVGKLPRLQPYILAKIG